MGLRWGPQRIVIEREANLGPISVISGSRQPPCMYPEQLILYLMPYTCLTGEVDRVSKVCHEFDMCM